jgi:hypothetical protein
MKFLEFVENDNKGKSKLINYAGLTVQKIIDMIDKAHVEEYQNSLSFNAGVVTHSSPLNNLTITLIKSDTEKFELVHEEDRSIIYITTNKKPTRKSLIDIINKDIGHKLKNLIAKYLGEIDLANVDTTSYDHEKKHHINSNSVEDIYQSMVRIGKSLLSKYLRGKAVVHGSAGSFHLDGDNIKKSSIAKLKTDFIGKNKSEFVSKLTKGNEDFNHLSKENKQKIISRLESFYTHEVELNKDLHD